MDISILTYNSSAAETLNLSEMDELSLCKNKGILWVNINGLENIEAIKKLENIYEIHPLTIEDVLSTKHQPKVETFSNYRFISFKTIHKVNEQSQNENENPRSYKDEIAIDQVSVIIMEKVLISFLENPDDPFIGIKKRILGNIGHIRTMGPDYLAYTLIDSVVDEYYLALAEMEDDIEDFEDRAIKTSNDNFIAEIQDAKKYLFQIKRAMLPLRENILILSHQIIPKTNDKLKPFLQDLQENLSNAIDMVEDYREWLTNIMDVNLSVLSYQMNKVMKILATVSAIFIPLTFIAGVYGMNFQFMPELAKPWAYPIVLGVMLCVALGMVIFFKIRKWF